LDAGPPPRRPPSDRPPHLAGHEYTLLTDRAPELVRAVMDELDEHLPAPAAEEPGAHTAEDVADIVDFLKAVLYVDDPGLFTSFIAWMARTLTARDVPTRVLTTTLDTIDAHLGDLPHAREILTRARAELRTAGSP
ncbi:MAG: cobalamin-binding protein, partial [Hamadaea sp.]|nr:cobalamin-binding protein [Hamadaea sp.]